MSHSNIVSCLVYRRLHAAIDAKHAPESCFVSMCPSSDLCAHHHMCVMASRWLFIHQIINHSTRASTSATCETALGMPPKGASYSLGWFHNFRHPCMTAHWYFVPNQTASLVGTCLFGVPCPLGWLHYYWFPYSLLLTFTHCYTPLEHVLIQLLRHSSPHIISVLHT
jgi:hypothetical protein